MRPRARASARGRSSGPAPARPGRRRPAGPRHPRFVFGFFALGGFVDGFGLSSPAPSRCVSRGFPKVTAGTCRASRAEEAPAYARPGDASDPAPGPHHRDAPGTGDVRAPKLYAGPAPNAPAFAPPSSFTSPEPAEPESKLESESEPSRALRRNRRDRREVAAAAMPARRPAPARRGGEARFGRPPAEGHARCRLRGGEPRGLAPGERRVRARRGGSLGGRGARGCHHRRRVPGGDPRRARRCGDGGGGGARGRCLALFGDADEGRVEVGISTWSGHAVSPHVRSRTARVFVVQHVQDASRRTRDGPRFDRGGG